MAASSVGDRGCTPLGCERHSVRKGLYHLSRHGTKNLVGGLRHVGWRGAPTVWKRFDAGPR